MDANTPISEQMNIIDVSDDKETETRFKSLTDAPYRDDTANERIVEAVGRNLLNCPCVCRIREISIFSADMAHLDGTMYVVLPESYVNADAGIVALVATELFKAVKGDRTAQPSLYTNTMYETYADRMHRDNTFTRLPRLDDAMGLLIATGEVPVYAKAFVKDLDGKFLGAPEACSCVIGRRLVERVQNRTATYEDETRCLALVLANVMGIVMGGGFEGASRLIDALGITTDELERFFPIITRED